MRYIFKFIFLLMVFATGVAQADLYTAQNVEMSSTGTNPAEAKNAAIRQGELTGFKQVIVALIGEKNEAFFDFPGEDEILEMVRDISILEEKNTATSYRGKMNVRFKEKSIQALLEKRKQSYLKKAPPVYLLIPVWQQGSSEQALEDENPFYQTLRAQDNLSDFFKIILPNGDVEELIAVNEALKNQDFSDVKKLATSMGAEQVLIIEVTNTPDGRWEMHPVSYPGTENIFENLFVLGQNESSLMEGWKNLTAKMAAKWQEEYLSSDKEKVPYYARVNVENVAEWAGLERKLKKLNFIENLTLQGATHHQLLLTFTYSEGTHKLIQQLDEAGFIWISDLDTLGTLKRKE